MGKHDDYNKKRRRSNWSCNTPKQKYHREEPYEIQLLLGGRGKPKLDLITVGNSGVIIPCPRGCQVRLDVTGGKENFMKHHIKQNGHLQLRVTSTVYTFHSLFKLQCGKSDIQQCPNCHQCCLELALPRSTAQVVPPLATTYHAQKRYAFSAALWAPEVNCQDELSKYLAEAIHVGYSLQRAIHTHERTDDIDTVLLTEKGLRHTDGFGLLDLLWKIREVEPVQVCSSVVTNCQPRFKKTFNKIRFWEMEEFDSVAALDLDLLIQPGVVDLFEVCTPAALFRGHKDTITGEKRPVATLYNTRDGTMQGGINAGVMVLTPSKAEFQTMERILTTPHHPRHIVDSNAPEQDFLSMHFGGDWKALGFKYNWQPYQLRYHAPGERMGIRYEDIEVIHFSAKHKPRDFLFEYGRQTIDEFKEHLIANYLGRTITSRHQEQRARIGRAIDDWFNRWDAAWDWILEKVARCETDSNGILRCPACHCDDICVTDPLHAFFLCPQVKQETLSFLHGYKERFHQSPQVQGGPMQLLRKRSVFPLALILVSHVHAKRKHVAPARSPFAPNDEGTMSMGICSATDFRQSSSSNEHITLPKIVPPPVRNSSVSSNPVRITHLRQLPPPPPPPLSSIKEDQED